MRVGRVHQKVEGTNCPEVQAADQRYARQGRQLNGLSVPTSRRRETAKGRCNAGKSGKKAWRFSNGICAVQAARQTAQAGVARQPRAAAGNPANGKAKRTVQRQRLKRPNDKTHDVRDQKPRVDGRKIYSRQWQEVQQA